MLEINAKP